MTPWRSSHVITQIFHLNTSENPLDISRSSRLPLQLQLNQRARSDRPRWWIPGFGSLPKQRGRRFTAQPSCTSCRSLGWRDPSERLWSIMIDGGCSAANQLWHRSVGWTTAAPMIMSPLGFVTKSDMRTTWTTFITSHWDHWNIFSLVYRPASGTGTLCTAPGMSAPLIIKCISPSLSSWHPRKKNAARKFEWPANRAINIELPTKKCWTSTKTRLDQTKASLSIYWCWIFRVSQWQEMKSAGRTSQSSGHVL